MSGNVHGLGYQLDKVTHCNKARGGCGAQIRWGTMFGKRHPFNLDGTSHFDTCPEADGFRKGRGVSLKSLGDRDTFYRERWRSWQSFWALDTMDRSRFQRVACPASVESDLWDRLTLVGGPYANWSASEFRDRDFISGAGLSEAGRAEVVFVRASFFKDLAFRLSVDTAAFQVIGVSRYAILRA